MSEGLKLTEASVRKLNKVANRVLANPESLMFSTQNGNNSERPNEDSSAILVYILGPEAACRLYKSTYLWYRFSVAEFYSNFAIPIQNTDVPAAEVIYQYKIKHPTSGHETDWITVPERTPSDTDAIYFKRFATIALDAIKTLQPFQDKEMIYEFVNNISKSTAGETEFNMVQFTFKEILTSSPYSFSIDRPTPYFMIDKVKYRRQQFSTETGKYYTYGPPSNTLFINPFYFEFSNLFFSSGVKLPITLLFNPNAGAIPNAYLSGVYGTEAIAYNVSGLGYVVTNVARRITYPLYNEPVIVYEE